MCDMLNIPTATSYTLEFLQAKKPKQVLLTNLAQLQLLCVPIFISGKAKPGIYNQPETPTVTAPVFANKKAKTAKGVLGKTAAYWHIYSCCPHIMIFLTGKTKTGTCNKIPATKPPRYDFYRWKSEIRYLQLSRQIPVANTCLTSYFG